MVKKKREKKVPVLYLYGALFLFAAAATLYAAAREIPGFADWYGQWVYPLMVSGLGRLCSLVPVSVAELGLYGIGAGIILGLVISCIKAVSRALHKRGRESLIPLLRWGAGVYFLAGILVFLYVCNCGVQYSRKSFSQMAGFERSPAALEELQAVCEMLIDEINETVPQLSFDESGRSILTSDPGSKARQAMNALGEEYAVMQGYYPMPKGVLCSEILSYQQLSGVYSPFTVEANYNADMPDWEIPATMCHELSHLRGFMREDEAGFIAYLACKKSQDPMFRYSGSMLAFSYCMNAYYDAAGADAYWELYEKLAPEAITDRRSSNAWWDQFEGKIAEVSNQVNDTYLKANNQTDGVKSYGRMADLMIAYWRLEHKE